MSCEKGFTLVELLVVIGIIGILAMMLLPQFRGMRDRARIASCQSNLKNVGTTLEAFYADNESYPNAAAYALLLPAGTEIAECPHSTTAYVYNESATLGTMSGTGVNGAATVYAWTSATDLVVPGTLPTRVDTYVVYCPFHTGLGTTQEDPASTQLFVTQEGVERRP